MTKRDYLELLMLISALESWSFSFGDKNRLPDWLEENIKDAVSTLKHEILKEEE